MVWDLETLKQKNAQAVLNNQIEQYKTVAGLYSSLVDNLYDLIDERADLDDDPEAQSDFDACLCEKIAELLEVDD